MVLCPSSLTTGVEPIPDIGEQSQHVAARRLPGPPLRDQASPAPAEAPAGRDEMSVRPGAQPEGTEGRKRWQSPE